jgi:hypothetical protein
MMFFRKITPFSFYFPTAAQPLFHLAPSKFSIFEKISGELVFLL